MDSPNPVSRKSSVFSQVISYFTSNHSAMDPDAGSVEPIRGGTESEMTSSEPMSSESVYLSKKAQRLQSAHKMSEKQNLWFKSPIDTPPFEVLPSHQESFPSYLRQKKFKPPEPEVSTSQFAFNINSNCYENLQVHQSNHNPYSPYLEEDFHTTGLQYFQVEHEPELPQPSFLPFGNLYDNIMDFVETTIVHYVCQRSHPSPFRLAAEILAKSKLNPNANEFTPTKKDVTVIETEPELYHICKPSETANFEVQESTKKGDSMAKIEEEINQTSGEKGNPVEEEQSCSKLVQCDAKNNSFCDLRINDVYDSVDDVLIGDSDDDCLSDEYDDDSDWDSEEQSTGQCVEIDPSEFEDLFPSPLMMTNLRICQTKSSIPELKICAANASGINQAGRTISEINCDFLDQGQITSCCKKSEKCVNFCDNVEVIEEPEDLAEDLQNARVSDFPARQADKERMERLLAPILTQVHRANMFQKIYGDN